MRLIRLGSRLAVLYLGIAAAALGAEADAGRLVFPLEEVSAFETVDLGHTCVCGSDPEPHVVYPPFTSGKPLYGVMRVDMELGKPHSRTPYPFALDESAGIGTGYDRLYVDLNPDGRLTDEPPIAPLRELPQGALFTRQWVSPSVWFGYVTFSHTDEAGTHSVQTLTRLLLGKTGIATLSFTATQARQADC